jgi:hypothetical protein
MRIYYPNLTNEKQLALIESRVGDMAKKALATAGIAAGLAFGGTPDVETLMKTLPSKYDTQMKEWVESDEFDPNIDPMEIPGYVDAVEMHKKLSAEDKAAADNFARAMNNKWKMYKDILPSIGQQHKSY